MTLLECPECKHNVSDKATACPSCGMPVALMIAVSKEEKAPDEIKDIEEPSALQEAKISEEEVKTGQNVPIPPKRKGIGFRGKCLGVFIAALVVEISLYFYHPNPLMDTNPLGVLGSFMGRVTANFTIAMILASFKKGEMGLYLGIAGALISGSMTLSYLKHEESRLIRLPAADLSLRESEIGTNYSMVSDLGLDEIITLFDLSKHSDRDSLKDASFRIFLGSERSLGLMILVQAQSIRSRDLQTLLTGFVDGYRKSSLQHLPEIRFTDGGTLPLADEAIITKADLPGYGEVAHIIGFRRANVAVVTFCGGENSQEQAKTAAQRILQKIPK